MASIFTFTFTGNIYAKINLKIGLGFYKSFVFKFLDLPLISVLNTSDMQENFFLVFLLKTENVFCKQEDNNSHL